MTGTAICRQMSANCAIRGMVCRYMEMSPPARCPEPPSLQQSFCMSMMTKAVDDGSTSSGSVVGTSFPWIFSMLTSSALSPARSVLLASFKSDVGIPVHSVHCGQALEGGLRILQSERCGEGIGQRHQSHQREAEF